MQAKFFLLATIVCISSISKGQSNLPSADSMKLHHKMNIIKTNITSIPLKNYSLQYERVVSKSVSIAVTFRTMPSTTIPFKSAVRKAVGDDEDTKDIIEKTELSNFAFTPEVRFYLGKGYGKGFYVAPYYRYVKFTTNKVPVSYNSGLGSEKTVTLNGDLTANTGGILFGAQWLLGKHIALDWWILGAHYGSGNGSFTGTPSTPLTLTEQNEIRQELEDIDIPLTEKTVTVTPNNVSVKLDGPFGGLRGGISLGFRF